MGPLTSLYHWSLDKRVLNKLKGTGFDTFRGFNKYLSLNIPLINVLISRYDVDTRSFILGSKENPFHVSLGLEDMLYITGLPIDGKPVTGVDPKDIKSVCQRYLGKHKGYGRKSDINLSWLKENFMTLPVDDEDLSEEELGYHVRAYVLYVIGCTFSLSGYNMVRAMFLPLLENVDDIGSYAWGAAFLAAIHDSMKKSTRYSVGLYFPLMIFAYMRFPSLSSTIEIDRARINAFPLAVSWSHALDLEMRQHFKNHNEEKLKNFFCNLKEVEEEVKWKPYGELSSNFLPQHLREQVVLSKSRTILICFEKAVYHRPDKCQRQLGLAGHILKGQLIQIKTQSRVGKKGYDWSMNGKYVDYISEWDKRFELLIDRHEEARRTEASLIADLRKENGKSKADIDNKKNSPKHVNRLSCSRRRRIDNVDVDHQSPVSSLSGLRKAAGNTSAGVTAIVSSNDPEAGLSNRKKSKKRKKTCCGGSDFPSSWEDLSREELDVKVWKKMKQVKSTNKELQQQLITLQSTNQALQLEKQKLEASDSQKDRALMQLQKNHLDEVSALKGQLKQKDETLDSHLRSAQEATKKVEEMVASLDQERAAAILKYKASPRFAEEFQIVMAPLLLHGCALGVHDAKAPDLDIGSLANRGQGDETVKRFKELADGLDILAMYKTRPPALDHTKGDENVASIVVEAGSVNDDDACSEKTLVLLDNQDPENDPCPFEVEARRAEDSLIAELRIENEKLKEEAREAEASLRKDIEKLKEEARLADASLIAELRRENEKLKEEIELCSKNFSGHVNRISRLENNALNFRVDNVDVDHRSPAGDTTLSGVRNSTGIRRCDRQTEAINVKKQRVSPSTTTTATAVGVVDRAEPPLIINIESDSDSDSDSDVSITDSYMDALVGTCKKVVK